MDWGRSVVERASMDGTTHTILHNSGLISPVSLALDRATQTLYWIDSKLDRLERSSVDGSNRRILITTSSSLDNTLGMALFQNTIFWTERVRMGLHSTSKLSPGAVTTLWRFNTGDEPYGLSVVTPSEQPLCKCSSVLVNT